MIPQETVSLILDTARVEDVVGDFVKRLDAAVWEVKTNQRARLDFMTYEMALLESKAEGIEKGIEQGEEQKADSIAEKMILGGMPFEKIAEFTELSIERIKALAKKILPD